MAEKLRGYLAAKQKLSGNLALQHEDVPKPVLIPFSVTANGLYKAKDANADGFKQVEVEVPDPETTTLSVTRNGTYTAVQEETFGFSLVEVNVPDPEMKEISVNTNGVYRALDENVYGFSKVTVAVPDPELAIKTISESGTYTASDDHVFGYSQIIANFGGDPLPTHFFDLDTGYVYNGSWMLGGSTVSYSDVYEVEADKHYLMMLGEDIGTRFRALFTSEDTSTATHDIHGTMIVNSNSPSAYLGVFFAPDQDGYLTITKDNAAKANIKTYVFDLRKLLKLD